MSSNNKFTDRDIAKLYMQTKSHYVELKKLKCSDSTSLFSTMYQNFHQSIENNLFGELSNDEKDRAFKLFKFIVESFDEFKHESVEREHVYIINQSDPYRFTYPCCYGRHQDDFLFDMMLCSVIMSHGHHVCSPYNRAYPSVVHTGGGIIHTGGGGGGGSGKTGHEVLLFLLAILLIACSIAVIAISGIYLMNRVSTDIERLTYNEGIARALISLALITAVGLAIATACTTIIALNFTGIALVPAIFVGVAATLTGAALTGIAYNYLLINSQQL